MLWTVKKTARILHLSRQYVLSLIILGELDAVKIGKCWRLVPESIKDYVKRHPKKRYRDASNYFVYTGNSGFLFNALSDCLQTNPVGQTTGMERRRRQLVYRARRFQKVLLPEFKSVTQLELFTEQLPLSFDK